jgi:hypothetical protein
MHVQIKGFFAKLTRRHLKYGVFYSVVIDKQPSTTV